MGKKDKLIVYAGIRRPSVRREFHEAVKPIHFTFYLDHLFCRGTSNCVLFQSVKN